MKLRRLLNPLTFVGLSWVVLSEVDHFVTILWILARQYSFSNQLTYMNRIVNAWDISDIEGLISQTNVKCIAYVSAVHPFSATQEVNHDVTGRTSKLKATNKNS